MLFKAITLATLFGVSKADTQLTLLHINDHHSHLTEDSAGYLNIYGEDIPAEVTENNSGTTYVRAYYGGFPRVITAMNELKAEAESMGRDVLKLHAGDAITGTTYFTLFEGDADAKLMNHACFDTFTPGNHEFDKGDAGLAKFLRALKSEGDSSTVCPSTPAILNANLVPHPESDLLAADVPPIENSRVFNVSNGEQVGVIGINVAQKTMQSSQPDPGTFLEDERKTAQFEIDALTAQGVNKIVIVTHIGYDNDQEWMTALDGVDVVVGGDSHSLLGDDSAGIFGSTRGPYATIIEKDDGTKVCVVQAWDYSKVVGNLHVDFDGDGNVISCEGSPVFPLNPDRVTVRDASPRYDMDAEDAAMVISSLITKSNGQAASYAEDAAALADLAVFSAEVDIISQTTVATASEFMGLEDPGYESGACDLVAQGFLLNPLSTADVAIQNRGGCRTSIDEGNFTINDAYTLLPFSNTMINIQMTGQQIHNVLEDAVDFYLDPAGSRGAYPKASGLRFDVNEGASKGSRITNLEVNARLAGSFEAIDLTSFYTVVTNNFIATPRDGYFEFGEIAEELKVDSYVEYAQSFIEYAQDVGTLVPVSDDNASTQTWTNTTEAANTQLTLLHINDHHSHLTEDSAGYLNIYGEDIPTEVTENNGGTTYVRAYYGGFPRVITAMNELKAEAESMGRDVLKLHAGDAITGTTYFTLFEGDADAKLMNHACFDTFTPGNHEFDKGDAGLAKFLRALKSEGDSSTVCPSTPAILNANLVPHPESALLGADVPPIENSRVFTVSNGEQVGVIGINVAQKTMQSSQPDPGTFLEDERVTAQAEIDALAAQGVNKIVIVTHIGYDNDQEWMTALDGVDVVVGGDSHSLLGDDSAGIFGSTRGPYATIIEKDDGTKVCVVQAWDYSKVVGNLHIDFDGDGNVMSCEGSPVFPLNPDRVTVRDASPRYDMDAEDAAMVISSLITRSNGQAASYAEDAAALADLAVFSAEVDIISQTTVATASEFMGLEDPGYESGACDLVAQGFLLNPLSTADVAIQNRGGCRTSIDEGNFTINDAYTLLPFSNTMMNIQMTGQQIHNVLEDAVDFYLDPAGSRGAYPKASGLRFGVNEAASKGSRITNLEVNAKLAGSFEAIDLTSFYTVVTNNFIATPRDGYFEFGEIAEELKVDSYVEYAQSFIEYAQDVGTLVPVSDDNASTQTWTNTTEAANTQLTLLHINDHHSHLTEDSAGYLNIYGEDIPAEVVENHNGTSYVRAYYGGFPRVITAMNELKAEAESLGRDVLKLHAGDAITGTTYFTLFEGDADAKLMNHACFDTFTPGNHEFDKGDAGLAKFLRALKSEGDSSTVCPSMPAILNANLVPHPESALLGADVPPIENSRVFTVSNGEQVGVIGINVAQKTMQSSQPDPGTFLEDERVTAQAEIDALTAQGVNMIVLVTHIGYDNDLEWMTGLDGVDVVVGGDSHSLLGDDSAGIFGSTRGPYATITEKDDGTKVCVVQAWSYSRVVGNLHIDFDGDGNVMSCEGSPVFPLNPDRVTVRDASPRYDMDAEDAAMVISSLITKSNGQAASYAEDAAASADLAVFSEGVEILSQTTVAASPEFIGLEAAGYESGACDLVAQAFLLNPLSTADVAIQNRGGCRSSIDEGNFTINDAYTLLPFSNTMVNIQMTGQQIRNVLEDAVDFYLDPAGSWGAYPRASGLRFDVNEGASKGRRITNLEVNVQLAGSFEAIDLTRFYTVVTNDFIATPRDGYFEFGEIAEELKVDSYVEYAQSFIEYAQDVGTLVPVSDDNASTQTWTNTTEAPNTQLTLLHINDHHSHLTEDSAGYLNIYGEDIPIEVTENHNGTSYVRAYYGGFPRVITAMNELKAEAESMGRDVLKLHAGDAITGTTYFTLFEGDADAKLMNHACFDTFTPGNHEFDKGDAGLAKFLRALKSEGDSSTVCPSTPAILNANLFPHRDSALLEADVPPIENSRVFTVSNGEQVGVIGINVAQKTMQSSQPDPGTILNNERVTAQAEIDALTAQGVNKIVLVTHIGYDNDQEWMAALNGVDVVVGGDSHSLLGDDSTGIFGSTRGPYATIIEKDDGTKVCVVQAWDYSKVVGNLHVDFDGDGNVISCEGSPVFPLNPDRVTVRDASPRYDMDAEDAAMVISSLITKSNGQAASYAEDTAAVADLAVFSEGVEILSQTTVATTPEFIGLEDPNYESGACDLVAQGFLLNPLSTADVAIQNRGGCRSSIEQGNFTINDAYTLLPFSNTMMNIQMTGQQIHNVLEDAVDFYLDPAGSRGAYPKASGLRFGVNEGASKGSRITNLEVNVKLAGSFEAIDLTSFYTVVTNNFIATPRDGYFEFGEIADELKVDSYVEYAQSFIEYAQDVGTLVPVSDDNASTQTYTNTSETNTTEAPSMSPEPSMSPTASSANVVSPINQVFVVIALAIVPFFGI